MKETTKNHIKAAPDPKSPVHGPDIQQTGNGNREYKSRLFSFLFGREENKPWTLSLYNAIHGTSYRDPSAITINTIEDVVYMGMKNDLSILVSETVSLYRSMELYEQQSSYNPNMPVREFMYAAKLYDKFLHSAKLNRYGRTLLPLPLPKLVVFYNGEDDTGDETMLFLSDAFKEDIRLNVIRNYDEDGVQPSPEDLAADVERLFNEASPDIEVKVRMININYGRNKKLLSACRPLQEYAWFVAQIRGYLSSSADSGAAKPGIGEAIDHAIDVMPQDFVIRGFILSNRAEVKDMCLTEYNEMETMEMLRQEGRIEGRMEGRIEGQQEAMLLNIRNLMDSTGWPADKIMEMLKVPASQRTTIHMRLLEKRSPAE